MPPVRVVTSPDNSFVPGESAPHSDAEIRGVMAVVSREGKTIEIPTGQVVVEMYAQDPRVGAQPRRRSCRSTRSVHRRRSCRPVSEAASARSLCRSGALAAAPPGLSRRTMRETRRGYVCCRLGRPRHCSALLRVSPRPSSLLAARPEGDARRSSCASARPSCRHSSLMRTSQTHVVRPRCRRVASARTSPPVIGRMKSVQFKAPSRCCPGHDRHRGDQRGDRLGQRGVHATVEQQSPA